MARHKDVQWNLPEGVPDGRGSNTHSWESIHAAILMDIRNELQALNQTLRCIRVMRMADATVRIDKRLQRHMPLPKGRSK